VLYYDATGSALGTLTSRAGNLGGNVHLSPVSEIAWVHWTDGQLDRFNNPVVGAGTPLGTGAGYTFPNSQTAVNKATGDFWIHKYYSGPDTGGDPFVEGSPLVRVPADGSPRQVVLNTYQFNFFGLTANYNGEMLFSDGSAVITGYDQNGQPAHANGGGWTNALFAASPVDSTWWFTLPGHPNVVWNADDWSAGMSHSRPPNVTVNTMVVNPDTNELWYAGSDGTSNNIYRLSHPAGLQPGWVLPVGATGAIQFLTGDPDTGDMYFAADGNIYKANGAGVLQWTLPGYTNVADMAWNPLSDSLWVGANTGGGVLVSIDSAGVATPIATGLGTIGNLDVSLAIVPEPASAGLLAVGSLLVLRRR
jgi:hypothetical protein